MKCQFFHEDPEIFLSFYTDLHYSEEYIEGNFAKGLRTGTEGMQAFLEEYYNGAKLEATARCCDD